MGKGMSMPKTKKPVDPTTMRQLSVRIHKDLHKEIKVAIVAREETMGEFAEKAFRAELKRGPKG